MKQANISYILPALFLLAGISGCTKVINVHLNSAAARYVVEANVTNTAGPYIVKITKSIDFDQDNVFPGVDGAKVVITDKTTGITDSLTETTSGIYQTSTLVGTPGDTYQLYISVDNNTYTATSAMPQPVPLDSIYAQKALFGGNSQLVPVYTDPAPKGNYYHFLEYKNDTETDNIIVRNDALVNGHVIQQPLGSRNLKLGDQVVLHMESIDSAVYQYYFTLQQTENQNSATPSNPVSNIMGGALGYFSAHTTTSKSIVVTQ